ncbi:hypothetical protein [Bifidobacterium bombi]|nr:hypothetical protein [Bifidobacterium bombi]
MAKLKRTTTARKQCRESMQHGNPKTGELEETAIRHQNFLYSLCAWLKRNLALIISILALVCSNLWSWSTYSNWEKSGVKFSYINVGQPTFTHDFHMGKKEISKPVAQTKVLISNTGRMNATVVDVSLKNGHSYIQSGCEKQEVTIAPGESKLIWVAFDKDEWNNPKKKIYVTTADGLITRADDRAANGKSTEVSRKRASDYAQAHEKPKSPDCIVGVFTVK